MGLLTRSVIVLILTLFLSGHALACWCLEGGGPACQEAWKTGVDAIFLGRVVKIDRIQGDLGMPAGAASRTSTGKFNRVTFEIEEVYRGDSSKTLQVLTAGDEGGCGYPFENGETYLVFAASHETQLTVSLCSATRPAKYATADIAYLQSLPTLAEGSRVYGNLMRYTFDLNFKPKFEPSIMDHYRPPEEEYEAMMPMEGVSIRVRAVDGEHQTVVDGNGTWNVERLPAGPYEIFVELPKKLLLFPSSGMRGELSPKGCSLVELRAASNGQIRGHINSEVPLSQYYLAQVGVFRAENSEIDLIRPFREVFPDRETGNYEFRALPPGRYFVAVLLDQHAAYDAAVFYPGVESLKSAKVFTLGDGESLSEIDFKIGRPKFRGRPTCCEFKIRVPKTN
jgi:hypothetical protein